MRRNTIENMFNQNKPAPHVKKLVFPPTNTRRSLIYNGLKISGLFPSYKDRTTQINERRILLAKTSQATNIINAPMSNPRRNIKEAFGVINFLARALLISVKKVHKGTKTSNTTIGENNNIVNKREIRQMRTTSRKRIR